MVHTDEQITAEEHQALMSHASRALELTPSERLRLDAYSKWLLTTTPETTGLEKRIDLLRRNSRAITGAFLSRLVALDEHIAPSEISAFQKFYRQLGRDPKFAVSDADTAAAEPLSVQLADPLPTAVIPNRTTQPIERLRNPDSVESAGALSLLPQSLIEASGHPALARIGSWIQSLQFQGGLAVTSYSKLREVWPSLPESEIAKRDAVMLSQCLARLGYGLEPDIRFGVHLVKATSPVVMFAISADSPSAPSAAYTSATLLSQLGAAMAPRRR